MDRAEHVPYHYLEWSNGRYFITEYPDVPSVELAIEIASIDEPVVSCILWGKSGREASGIHPNTPRPETVPAERRLGCILLVGYFLLITAIVYLVKFR